MSNIKLILTENKSSPYRKQRVVGRLGDGGLTTIDVELLKSDGKTPYSVFSNHDLIFVGTNAKGEYTDGVPEILDGQKGMIRYTFTKDNFSVLKEFKRAYFQLTDADGNRITFQDFTVDVLNNSDIDQGQVTLYVRLLDQLLSDFEKRFGDQSIDFEERFKVFLQAKESQYQSIYQMYNDLVIKLNNLSKDAKSLQEVQAEILKSIEEHDVFTKQESSANVINQIGGAESAILKKELLVDGTEGTAQRYIKDIPNLALGDPLYTEYNVVPGQPNLLNGTSSTLSEVTFIQTQYKETNLVVSNLFKQNDLVTYAVQIDNTAGTADVFAQLAFKKSGNTYVSFNGSSVLKGSIGRSMVQVTVLEEYTNIYVKPLVKSNSTISTTVRYGEEKLIKGSLEAMDEWTPSQADSGLTPINGGMVPFNEKDYEDLLSDDGIVRAETKIVGRGAEIEFKFDVIGTLEKKYPYLFEGLSSMAEKVEKYLSIVKKVEYSELSRGGGSSSSTGNSAYFSKPYIKVTTGSGTFWGLSSFANSSATFSRLGTVLSALSTKQLDDKGRYTTYSVSKKNNFTEPGAISDGVTSAWVEVKDIRLTVELEVNGRTIIEELIAANHIENIATEEEAEAGENNEKTMTPLRVFQAIAKWTKDKFVSRTENETVLGVKNFANGLQVGGNNVLTQNGEIRFVTNSTNNSSLESGSIVFKRYGDDVDIYANFQVRASGDLTRDMNIVAESIVDDIFEPGENFSFFVGNETAQAVVKFVGKGIKAHSTLTKGIWYVGTASYKAKNKL
ncbi:BppU family phage baseplate upper protein [Enterococcus avium]|uniref:BppU family phage baseplate upper protein n=2 Tax=Enterococcus avium TaxID=33945 RepID=UPI001FCC2F65|nr:BppU family phage baseplate upper protein [Enterococcus avium]